MTCYKRCIHLNSYFHRQIFNTDIPGVLYWPIKETLFVSITKRFTKNITYITRVKFSHQNDSTLSAVGILTKVRAKPRCASLGHEVGYICVANSKQLEVLQFKFYTWTLSNMHQQENAVPVRLLAAPTLRNHDAETNRHWKWQGHWKTGGWWPSNFAW